MCNALHNNFSGSMNINRLPVSNARNKIMYNTASLKKKTQQTAHSRRLFSAKTECSCPEDVWVAVGGIGKSAQKDLKKRNQKGEE